MSPLKKISDYLWELPTSYKPGMRVPGRVYASEKMLEHIVGEHISSEQIANVTFLPGIVNKGGKQGDGGRGSGKRRQRRVSGAIRLVWRKKSCVCVRLASLKAD